MTYYKKAFKATKILSACEFTFKLDKDLLCSLRALAVKKNIKV